MIAKKGSILVEVDLNQKVSRKLGDADILSGKRYHESFMEKNPVMCRVLDGIGDLRTGDLLICNYNYFDSESPFRIDKNVFSIPVDEEIYAKIDEDGSPSPVCGNILVDRVLRKSPIDLPSNFIKPEFNQGIVKRYSCGYRAGTYLFWLPMSDLEISYLWDGVDRRLIKVHKSEVVGVLGS